MGETSTPEVKATAEVETTGYAIWNEDLTQFVSGVTIERPDADTIKAVKAEHKGHRLSVKAV
jgi:hypothetical protein